jgi:hypothetical protein
VAPQASNSCIENVCLYRRSCWIWHIYSHARQQATSKMCRTVYFWRI